jgi:mono/diheme cytochrome c family protein
MTMHPTLRIASHFFSALALAAASPAATAATPAGATMVAADKAAQIARGKYLATAIACGDCHTPLKLGPNGPEPDMSRQFSGHPGKLVMPAAPSLPPGPWQAALSGTNTAWAGPWGVSFTANLTPDAQTGMGAWTAKQFIDTMRTGRHFGSGRPVLPPMPCKAYGQMTDGDLTAIFAYLQSVPAISNQVPAPRPPAGAGSAKP